MMKLMNAGSATAPIKLAWKVWWIPLLAVLAVFGYLFLYFPYNIGYGDRPYSIGYNLWLRWETEMWEHGKYVPLICMFVIYMRRKYLAALPVEPSLWGGALLVFSLLLFWVGYVVDVTYFSYFTLHVFIASLVLFFLGKEWFKGLLFPLAFLFFACPYDFLEGPVTVPLRHFMAQISSMILNLVGVPVVKVGTGLISAGDPLLGIADGARFQLDVADPCSGMRSLFALLMLSALSGYLMLKDNRKRWILFLSSIPMAVAGNVVRILLLTFGTIFFGKEFAIGTLEHPSAYHMGAGLAVFAVAMGGVITVGYVLENFSSGLAPLLKDWWVKLTVLPQELPKRDDSLNNKDSY